MANTPSHTCTRSQPTTPRQGLIEVLGRLQSYILSDFPSSVYVYDLVDQCTLCASHSIASILGYTEREIRRLEPLGLATLIHPDDILLVSDHFQRFTTLVEEEVITVEYRMKRADGTWSWLRSYETVLIKATDGFPVQILGIVQDITKHECSDGIWRAFSYLVEQLPEVVFITDQDGVILYVNQAFQTVTGYLPEEVIGRTPAILKSGQHNAAFYRHLWNTLHAGQMFQAEFVNRKKNGDLFYLEQTITPIKNSQNQITHFIAKGKVTIASRPLPESSVDLAITQIERDRESMSFP